MLKLLKSKGYNGEDSLEPIVNWLISKQIFPQFELVPNENGDDVLGYKVIIRMFSCKSKFISSVFKSYRDALTSVVYNISDFI